MVDGRVWDVGKDQTETGLASTRSFSFCNYYRLQPACLNSVLEVQSVQMTREGNHGLSITMDDQIYCCGGMESNDLKKGTRFGQIQRDGTTSTLLDRLSSVSGTRWSPTNLVAACCSSSLKTLSGGGNVANRAMYACRDSLGGKQEGLLIQRRLLVPSLDSLCCQVWLSIDKAPCKPRTKPSQRSPAGRMLTPDYSRRWHGHFYSYLLGEPSASANNLACHT